MILDDFSAVSVVTNCTHGCNFNMDHLPLVVYDNSLYGISGSEEPSEAYLLYKSDADESGFVKSLTINLSKNDDDTYKVHDIYMYEYNVPGSNEAKGDESEDEGAAPKIDFYYGKTGYLGGVLADSIKPVPGGDAVISLRDMGGCDITVSLHGKTEAVSA